MSAVAESAQLVMMQRDPSLIDVAANVLGAIVGVVVARLIWSNAIPAIRLTRWRGLAAGVIALALVWRVWAASGAPLNARGFTAPGILEAHWKLNEQSGRIALDSSGHGLNAALNGNPVWVQGKLGGAIHLDGVNDYLDAGRSSAFRMVGNMTVSAWIRASSFPIDDAALVSTLQGGDLAVGWQFDTTIDRGPRTIGFKLTNACGNYAARYGATPLVANTWYHVAAVFDGEHQRMDVYLNGVLDNGVLVGSVTRMRRTSRASLSVGRRSDLKGFEFIGTLDDVRVYSIALTAPEIVATMNGDPVSREKDMADPGGVVQNTPGECSWLSEREDGRLPGAVALVGVLAAVLCVALVPGRLVIATLVSGLVGLLIYAVSAATLPPFNLWMFPLTSAAGAVSVALSLRRPGV